MLVIEEPGLVWARAEALLGDVLAAHARARENFPHMTRPPSFRGTGALQAGDGPVRLGAVLGSLPRAGRRAIDRGALLAPESFGRRIETLARLPGRVARRGLAVTILCDNEGQRTRLHELLVEDGLAVELQLGVISAPGSCSAKPASPCSPTTSSSGAPGGARAPRRFSSGFGLKELRSLKPGSAIVHVEHGIGRSWGLTRLEVNGHHTDVCQLEYQGGDKLYVPVDQLDLIQRYASEEGKSPGLSRLGGTGWAKTKEKAKRAIQEIAGELVRTYALRKAHPGHAFGPDTPWQRELEGSFPFEETPDQLTRHGGDQAGHGGAHPMDRLLCGDVGYGKTEVAVRAAFKAVLGGKQVAMLVPTTILAEQHCNTFSERFRDFPVQGGHALAASAPPRSATRSCRGPPTATLDMVIGTHALLGKSVRFKNLGPGDRGRGAALRGGAQGAAQATAGERGRAHADRHPHPAHPEHVAAGRARHHASSRPRRRSRLPVQHRRSRSSTASSSRRRCCARPTAAASRSSCTTAWRSIHTMAAYMQKLCPAAADRGGARPDGRARSWSRSCTTSCTRRIDVLVATMIIESGPRHSHASTRSW